METATVMDDENRADSPEPSNQPPEAAWSIVLDNMGLVYRVIKDFCPGRIDRDDLIQEGMLGLLEAARRFDETRQIAFSTYAYYWVKNRILTALREDAEFLPFWTDNHDDSFSDEPPEPLGDGLQSKEDVLEPPEIEYIRNDLARDLREHLVNDLDEIERLVIVLHWLAPETSTLEEIAKALGLRGHASVSEIENLALAKLRQAMLRRRK